MDGSINSDAWIEICGLEDVPVRGSRVLKLGGREIGIFRTASHEIFAIDNYCPHKQGPLSEGIVHDNGVTCPLHNMVIDLASGQARAPDTGCVDTFSVENREGRLFIKMAK